MEENPVAQQIWAAECPVCGAWMVVDFCGGAPLVSCHNHDEAWYGHAKIPVMELVTDSDSTGAAVEAIQT